MTTQKLSITLPAGTLYVSGTVNGIETTWTNTHDNTWETIVDKANDGKYAIVLTIVSDSGATNTESLTLFYGLHLITDRTQEDVDTETFKGFYNAEDLNRVNSAVQYITEKYSYYGYYADVKTKIDWKYSDLIDSVNMAQYLQNVINVKEAFPILEGCPELPATIEYLDYIGANNIEKLFEFIDYWLKRTEQSWFYSDEISCGEV